jgi:hypothetical protein
VCCSRARGGLHFRPSHSTSHSFCSAPYNPWRTGVATCAGMYQTRGALAFITLPPNSSLPHQHSFLPHTSIRRQCLVRSMVSCHPVVVGGWSARLNCPRAGPTASLAASGYLPGSGLARAGAKSAVRRPGTVQRAARREATSGSARAGASVHGRVGGGTGPVHSLALRVLLRDPGSRPDGAERWAQEPLASRRG